MAIVELSKALRNYFATYTITTKRLILHQGLLNTKTTELKLCYCSNLVLKQKLAGKIMDYGDFGLRSGGVDIFFNDVPNPLEFKKTLTMAINHSTFQ